MAKFKYLIKVEPGENNNKYYKMNENTDGTFTATYGRVGAKKPATEIYPMSKWETKLKEKLSKHKGYQDNTDLFAEVKTIVGTTNNVIADEATVVSLIMALQGYAKANTAKTYLVQADSVTQAQVTKAQQHIDAMVDLFQNKFTDKEFYAKFNAELLDLFRTIPRIMKEIGEHLIYAHDGHYDKKEKKFIEGKAKKTPDVKAEIEKLINDEQSNLDTMASQVISQAGNQPTGAAVQKSQTLLETLGLKVKAVTDSKEIAEIKKYAQEHSRRVLRVFAVENVVTQKAFDRWLAKVDNTKVDTFWHGSRNQNWWWIIQQGLKIRPSNAVHTGSMFGDGMYFASECDKSMGYTDSGRWARGSSNGRVYMALYNVHIGRQYVTERSDGSLSAGRLKSLGNYHSTWGKKGMSLMRHEYIIYNSDQSTIKYLIEFQD